MYWDAKETRVVISVSCHFLKSEQLKAFVFTKILRLVGDKPLQLSWQFKERMVFFFQVELDTIYALFLIAYYGYDKKIHRYI